MRNWWRKTYEKQNLALAEKQFNFNEFKKGDDKESEYLKRIRNHDESGMIFRFERSGAFLFRTVYIPNNS
eukprot:IDg12518t1